MFTASLQDFTIPKYRCIRRDGQQNVAATNLTNQATFSNVPPANPTFSFNCSTSSGHFCMLRLFLRAALLPETSIPDPSNPKTSSAVSNLPLELKEPIHSELLDIETAYLEIPIARQLSRSSSIPMA